MKTIPLVVLSYSWILHHHEDYSDEELTTALYWLETSWYDHIQYDNGSHARDPQVHVKPFIAKAVEEGRYRHTVTDGAFNEELVKLGLPPMKSGYVSRSQVRQHLDKLGVRYTDG